MARKSKITPKTKTNEVAEIDNNQSSIDLTENSDYMIENMTEINPTTFENDLEFNQVHESIDERVDSYYNKEKASKLFRFGDVTNVLLLLMFVYFVFSVFINLKEITKSYERVFLNDIKDLLYWSRYTLGSVGIVYFVMFVLGINLSEEIKKDNKSVVILSVAILLITSWFGLKLFS